LTYRFITTALDGDVFVLTLNRPEKRNAIGDAMLLEIEAAFANLPTAAKAVVLAANGPHFCAGLDLGEHHSLARSPAQFMHMCQAWHRVFDKIQYGGIPVIAALHGAVVGGGLELAAAAHVRVADPGTYFALPEGQKGIFTGGGATVRVARIISASRMVEMMLTGRVIDAPGAAALGLVHEISAAGESLSIALSTARRVATNAPLSNYAIVTSISRIAEMSSAEGLFAESLMAAVVQSGTDVQSRLGSFVEKSLPKVMPLAA
jgi:enoyl-CoA hydratase/carnithine racemase